MNNVLDFSIRANPLGMPPKLEEILSRVFSGCGNAAFDDNFINLREIIASRHGAHFTRIALNSDEETLLLSLVRAARGARTALLPVPCPASYVRVLEKAGLRIRRMPLSERDGFHFLPGQLKDALRGCDLLLMGNPAFPSSALFPPAPLLSELDDWLYRGGRLILDERAIDFTYGSVTNSLWSGVRNEKNVVILRSFTDFLSLRLLPLCYAVGDSDWIAGARDAENGLPVPPVWQFLTPALEHLAAFRVKTTDITASVLENFTGRMRHIAGMRALNSEANWVLCRFERDDIPTDDYFNFLKKKGITVPRCIDGCYFTVAAKHSEDMNRLVDVSRELLMPK